MPLTAKKSTALESLLAAPTIRAAAKKCGVAEQTLHRWLREPDFASALRARQEEVLAEASGLLKQHTLRAIRTLLREMTSKTSKGIVRLNAADKVLTHALRLREAIDVASAIRQLKDEVDQLKGLSPKPEAPK